MTKQEINYSSFANESGNPFRDTINNDTTGEGGGYDNNLEMDNEDTPRNSGIMIHVVPETSKSSWNHIEDLDSFFTRMYCYHQKHGFAVIVLDEIFQLCEFAFVVWLITFITHCLNYPILFGEIPPPDNHTKVSLHDVIIPMNQCVKDFSIFTYISLIAASLLFLLRLFKVLYHISQYWDIKKFYNTALNIDDNELDNITWHEVQKKIREVQSEEQMCIHKEQLTELDIYHRILRFKNYMVALMNKNLLPCRFSIPIIGEVVTLSRGLLYNIELILFRGPWSPFENNWQLRGDLAIRSNRTELARRLSRQIMWVAAANFILSPFVFLWQLTYISFSHATILRREPGSLGVRTWSNYGRLYLRHFNELDHELDARLNRAYEPADRYMSSFSSPIMSVIAKNILFICGGILLVILLLGIYEEHVFQVEHVLTIATLLTGVGVICRVLLPDENLIWCPEQLMTAILAHVHYLPTQWRGLAHTSTVRNEFSHFFQFKAVYLLNELLSPILTPFILLYVFRPRALDIVDFFRSFTVSVVGVGNVCSFAQMDVRKHGNPDWQPNYNPDDKQIWNTRGGGDGNQKEPIPKNLIQGEHGKIELSLIHFTLTNPEWKMPPEAKNFIQELKQHALQDLKRTKAVVTSGGIGGGGDGVGGIIDTTAKANTAMTQSLMSFGSIGDEYSSIAQSVLQNHNIVNGYGNQTTIGANTIPTTFPNYKLRGGGVAPSPSNKNLSSGGQSQNIPSQTASTSVNISGGGGGGHIYDFEHMLQQNLYDGSSIPMRSGFLENIKEGDNESEDIENATKDDQQQQQQQIRQTISTSNIMEQSMRKMGVRRSEGRLEGPQDSLLYSLYGINQNIHINPTDITTADMCLSTLYLHELHRRQIQKKSQYLAQSQKWHSQQLPRHHISSPSSYEQRPSTSSSSSSSHQIITDTKIAENTPLLTARRS